MTTLPFRTRIIVDEIIAQLKSRQETLQGIEATIIEKELAYRRGQFVVKKINEEKRTLGGEQSLDDIDGLLELLTGSRYHLKELTGSQTNEVRLRAHPVAPQKFSLKNFTKDNISMTLILQRVPVRLLCMKADVIDQPWWFKRLLKVQDDGVVFEYVRGIPVPKKASIRTLSRGIGSWRWGMGEETEIRYANV